MKKVTIDPITLATAELYQSMIAHNSMVGKKHFSFDMLRNHLLKALDWARSIDAVTTG
jgi:hypothetical protein